MADKQSKLTKKRDEIKGLVGGLSSPKDDTVRSKVIEIRKKLQDIEKIVPDPDVIYDWDQYFMSIACLAALRSKDQSVPVGACIVNSDKRVVGIGYNSMPYIKGHEDDDSKVFPWTGKSGKPFEETRYDYDKKLLYVVHAVVNAIINRTILSLEGCTIYVTLKPDRDCAHAIIQAGISTVKYGSFIKQGREAKPDITGATKLLDQGEVNLIKYVVPKEPVAYICSDKKNTTISLSKRMKLKQKNPDYLTWEQFFMAVAMLSKKKQGRHGRRPQSTQGACIASKEKKVISIGYSGYPEQMNYRAVNEETDMDYYAGDPYICHAEYDAILSTGTPPVKDCTLYVTKYPCNDCAKVIVQSGIREVIYVPDNDTPQDGQQHYTLEELIEETDQKEQTKKKKHNMYLGSKRILTKCCLVPYEANEKIEVILHDPGVIVEIFCATDQKQRFNVTRDGIGIVVPPFAKPNKIRIGVQLHPSGPFVLPANCQPISCFFQIQISPKFNEPIEVHLEHHAELLSKNDSKELGFIICPEPSLPYKFQFADYKAITSFKENYGVLIQVPKFCIFAITISLEFSNNLRYVWMVYYKEIETNTWELNIVVTKDLRPFKQRAKDVYSDWIEYIEPKKFQFGEDNYIQYNKVEKSWKVDIIAPCQINKSDVDKSTPDSALQHFQLYIKSDGSEDSIEQPCAPLVTLHGMRTENVFFKFLPTKVSYASKYEQFDKTYGMPDIPVLMSFGVIEKVHKPYICARFSMVLDKWEAVGHMLGVPNSDLAIIKRDNPACESCCEEMFRKWIQLSSTSCNWKTILVALAIVGEEALAEEIVPKLSFA